MTIELKLISIIIQDDMQENYTGMFPISQSYLPVQKQIKIRRPRKKKETVANVIDNLLHNIDSME